ncbi:lysozyme inhibitor LprI family protein [Sphingomonas psychrolutea]|uniref:Lysozyme inhibitor LprI-like N-terminal domain-containing protein n=1 Tax=Sphingomonas psychrolutea TaxID=1259676 RepID=A0ABQ1H3C2_9SPHN|nr:lysozyme inhibitor LprI family protein [Sphingomonas psychrolutea]GGA55479.1 hypothetical protein GCM10011395_27340 [Sphingomonas psychrolutea]
MNRFFMALATLSLAAPVSAQTQAHMNASADGAFHRADNLMAQQWKITFARMKARDAADTSRGGGFGYAATLLASQRAWLAFRDKECTIEGGEFAGGSLQGMTITQCRTGLTEARTQQLRKLEWRR